MTDPFKGLMPYTEADAGLFFGRDRDREVIAANLMATRFTLLYGPSGVGKSSVLRAGAIHDLKLLMERNTRDIGLPEFTVVWLNAWRDDPIAAFERAVRDSVADAMGGDGGAVEGETVVERLRQWTRRLNGEIYIVCDQFEEYFLYHPLETPGTFGDLLGQIVSTSDLRANVLVSLREDAVAQMDRFKGRIPGLFANYLRIDRLKGQDAVRAIEGPIEYWNTANPNDQMKIEEQLIREVLDQVGAGKLGLSGTSASDAESLSNEARPIETPYLQLVMRKLWASARAVGASTLGLGSLKEMGGARKIVSSHVETILGLLTGAQRGVLSKILYHLITPSGAKIAHTADDLSTYTGLSSAKISDVLTRLGEGDARLFRPVAAPDDRETVRFEIYHDVLGSVLLDWQSRATQRNSIRKFVLRTAVGIAIVGAVVGYLVFNERTRLERRYNDALLAKQQEEVNAWIRTSKEFSDVGDMSLAIAYAHKALPSALERRGWDGLGEQPAAVTALSRAMGLLHERVVLRGFDDLVQSVEFSPDASKLLTIMSDGTTALLYDLAQPDKPVANFRSIDSGTLQPVFSIDGTKVPIATRTVDIRPVRVERTRLIEFDLTTGKSRARRFNDTVLAMGFDQKGETLAVTYDAYEGTVSAESLDQMQEDRVISDFQFSEPMATVSPDGEHVAILLEFGELQVWDGVSTVPVPQPLHESARMVFSRTGRYLLAYSEIDVQAWSLPTIEPVPLPSQILEQDFFEFSADDTFMTSVGVQTGAEAYKTSYVWNTTNPNAWTVGVPLKQSTRTEPETGFLPDGTPVALTASRSTATLWNIETGTLIARFAGHDGPISGMAVSPDGTRVATTSQDKTVRVWEVVPRGVRAVLTGHAEPVLSAALSSDGSMVASASESSGLWVWRLPDTDAWASQSEAPWLKFPSSEFGTVTAVSFVPDGSRVVWATCLNRQSTCDAFLTVADTQTGAILSSTSIGSTAVERIYPNKDATEIFIQAIDRTLHKVSSLQPDATQVLTGARVLAMDRLADGTLHGIFVQDVFEAERNVALWSSDPNQPVLYLADASARITSAAFSADGENFVLTTANSGQIWRFADTDADPQRRGIRFGREQIAASAAAPDGVHFLFLLSDGTAWLWAEEPVRQFSIPGSAILMARFTRDGRRLITLSDDQTVRLWDMDAGSVAASLAPHEGGFLGLAHTPDGDRILTTLANGTGRVWATFTTDENVIATTTDILDALDPEGVRTPEQ